MSISTLLKENLFYEGLKIRYMAWSHIKFISIDRVDKVKEVVHGFYDNGEACTFSIHLDFWEVYYNGAENTPMAV